MAETPYERYQKAMREQMARAYSPKRVGNTIITPTPPAIQYGPSSGSLFGPIPVDVDEPASVVNRSRTQELLGIEGEEVFPGVTRGASYLGPLAAAAPTGREAMPGAKRQPAPVNTGKAEEAAQPQWKEFAPGVRYQESTFVGPEDTESVMAGLAARSTRRPLDFAQGSGPGGSFTQGDYEGLEQAKNFIAQKYSDDPELRQYEREVKLAQASRMLDAPPAEQLLADKRQILANMQAELDDVTKRRRAQKMPEDQLQLELNAINRKYMVQLEALEPRIGYGNLAPVQNPFGFGG